mmetsp:Transcript_5848/g.14631  ORF Transcript_5848/g.14631 Transcript_5848/m.14631 type:complete len:208 (+) Transcript_5848:238-861(+)
MSPRQSQSQIAGQRRQFSCSISLADSLPNFLYIIRHHFYLTTRKSSNLRLLETTRSEKVHPSMRDFGDPTLHNQCRNVCDSSTPLSLNDDDDVCSRDMSYSYSPSTVLRDVFRHHPLKPNSSALSLVCCRKYTPWTFPEISNLIDANFSSLVGIILSPRLSTTTSTTTMDGSLVAEDDDDATTNAKTMAVAMPRAHKALIDLPFITL